MLEVNQFTDQVYWYISSSFKNNPPKEGFSTHIQNLINSTWLQSLEYKRLKNLTLEGVVKLIKQEAALRMPKHQRRMALLNTKKTGTF